MGNTGMVTRLGVFRFRLERPRRRVAWQLAADPDRGVHRSCGLIFHGRVCERHRGHNRAPFGC
jgi:hypothetical protein